MSVVCVCRGVRVCVYEQMLQLYPDERCQKKKRSDMLVLFHLQDHCLTDLSVNQ